MALSLFNRLFQSRNLILIRGFTLLLSLLANGGSHKFFSGRTDINFPTANEYLLAAIMVFEKLGRSLSIKLNILLRDCSPI